MNVFEKTKFHCLFQKENIQSKFRAGDVIQVNEKKKKLKNKGYKRLQTGRGLHTTLLA